MRTQPGKGVTLVEVLIAMFIFGLSVLPIISTFSQSFTLASKQVDQEMGLKIAEAAMNKVCAVEFGALDTQKSGPANTPLPFEIQTPAGMVNTVINLGSSNLSTAAGGGMVTIGKTEFRINVSTSKEFEGFSFPVVTPPTNALVYSFPDLTPLNPPAGLPFFPPPPDFPPGAIIASYSCPQSFLKINVDVTYGDPRRTISLTSFRADLRE